MAGVSPALILKNLRYQRNQVMPGDHTLHLPFLDDDYSMTVAQQVDDRVYRRCWGDRRETRFHVVPHHPRTFLVKSSSSIAFVMADSDMQPMGTPFSSTGNCDMPFFPMISMARLTDLPV
jgi:hypothetical protein